jgi:hypothetical protein
MNVEDTSNDHLIAMAAAESETVMLSKSGRVVRQRLV